MKTEVLAAIGESELSRPASVNAALAANDRVKYALTLLQIAAAHADHPEQRASSLQLERVACGIDDPLLDSIPDAARRLGSRYHIPGAARLLERIAADLREMAAPVIDAGDLSFAARLEALLSTVPDAAGGMLDATVVAAMTRAGEAATDSVHQLVMDLHKALNAQQAKLAQENVDGAATYGLTPEDRPRVAAFMAGINRTGKLKLNHPGLGTTASRRGSALIIQNDIGETDAHVIVVHVEGLAVSVTYTDVHEKRLLFFQELLARYQPNWSGTRPGSLGRTQFHLVVGRVSAADEVQCRAYLEFLGSRLVFLIDWNRARKQVRNFLPGEARFALLRWAAEQELGHRGFLELGGARLINHAIEAVAGSAMHFGDRLCDTLGVADTEVFLRFVLRAATEGLLARQSSALIHDRVRAELARHLSNEEHRLLLLASEHAGLIFELASLVHEGLLSASAGGADDGGLAAYARNFEHDADELVLQTREAVKRRPDYAPFARLLKTADDAADELEDAAFLLTLLCPVKPADGVLDALRSLTALLVAAAQEWAKVVAHATHVQDENSAEDVDDLLTALDRVAALEHEADDAERTLTVASVQHARDFRELHLYTAIGAKLEAASDALKQSSLMLRNHVLDNVLGS